MTEKFDFNEALSRPVSCVLLKFSTPWVRKLPAHDCKCLESTMRFDN